MAVRVLVVDDVPSLRTSIRQILNASGKYEIAAEAENGQEAVQKFQELHPDVIIMDIVMPVLDGIEATRQIVAHDPRACIVICGSAGQEPLVIESIAVGARDFVVKPYSAEKVLKVLDRLIRR